MDNANWLLSALAQTAGALVAIVGGFLVSRLVGLSSQRNGLLERMTATTRRLEAARDKKSAARKDLVTWETGLLETSLLWDLVESRGDVHGLDMRDKSTHTLTEEVSACVKKLSPSGSDLDS